MRMKGDAPQQIIDALRKPIGAAPLRELAAGRTTAAITFTRATSTYLIAPHILAELTRRSSWTARTRNYGAGWSPTDLSERELQKCSDC